MGWAGNAGKGWGGGGRGLAILVAVAAAAHDRHSVGDVIWHVWHSWAHSFCQLHSGVTGGSLIINVRYDKWVDFKRHTWLRAEVNIIKGNSPKSKIGTKGGPKSSAQKRVQNPIGTKGVQVQDWHKGTGLNPCSSQPMQDFTRGEFATRQCNFKRLIYNPNHSWPVLKWGCLTLGKANPTNPASKNDQVKSLTPYEWERC